MKYATAISPLQTKAAQLARSPTATSPPPTSSITPAVQMSPPGGPPTREYRPHDSSVLRSDNSAGGGDGEGRSRPSSRRRDFDWEETMPAPYKRKGPGALTPGPHSTRCCRSDYRARHRTFSAGVDRP